MQVEEDRFFRKAALLICADLEIENAMSSLLQFLRQVMPADTMFLEYYDPSFSAMRTIARATCTESTKLDLLTPLSEEARKTINDTGRYTTARLLIHNDPFADPIGGEMLRFHGIRARAYILMPLLFKGRPLGNVVLISEGKEGYTDEQGRLFGQLREPFAVALRNALAHREIQKLKSLLADDNRYLRNELHNLTGGQIIGARFGLKATMELVERVAAHDSPVLLLGETGVGKDLIARSIHLMSPRKDGPFISVNCGAIPEGLMDSELFGHEKGSFTGALAQKRGRFERADKGTIFLDEIAELPTPAQVRMLRVLQSREIERVGSTKTIQLDIRVIAATNRNLEQMVGSGEFREDLWYRLSVFPITIPPLRERKLDIPALVQHFITQKCREMNLASVPTFAPGVMDTLMNYRWPGNVRELQNVVERAIILAPEGPLSFEHLQAGVNRSFSATTDDTGDGDELDRAMVRHIRKVLQKTGGKIHGPDGAADLLGMNPSTLRYRLKKLGITVSRR